MPAAESRPNELPQPIKDLLAWGTENGATLHPHAEVYVSPTFGVSLRVKEHGSQNRAAALPAHSTIVSTPYTTSLSYINAYSAFPTLAARSPLFPQKFLDEAPAKVIGCYFLMQQYLLGDASFWAPYIRSLPQPYEPEKLATPLYWPEEARTWLRGTNLDAAVRAREEAWGAELERAARCFWDGCAEMEVPAERYGKLCTNVAGGELGALYKWASTIFSSRSFVSSLIPAEVYGERLDEVREGKAETWREFLRREGAFPVLFPLVDIANHDPAARVEWFADARSEVKSVSIRNDEVIAAGEQIFNNYAPKGNSELLLGYGFMIPDNDDFAIEMKVGDRRKLAFVDLWKQAGQGEDSIWLYHIKLKPYPDTQNGDIPGDLRFFEPGLIDLLRVLVANEREENEMAHHPTSIMNGSYDTLINSPISGRNTAATLSLLKKRLEISLEKLVLIPQGPKPIPGSPTSATFVQMARQYRTGQLKVLVNALNVLHARLTPLICADTPSTFTHEEWPQDPVLTLSTAFKFLGAVRPQIYKSLRRIICSSTDTDAKIDFEDADVAATTWIDDVLHSFATYTKPLPEEIFREALWALWLMAVIHIDENVTQQSAAWPDNLANWVQEMLDVYRVRPVPEETDDAYWLLCGWVSFLVGVVGEESEEGVLQPRRKTLAGWNAKKPKLVVGEGEEEEKEENALEDYWRKLAAVALKVVRAETVQVFGPLKRVVKDEMGGEREVWVNKDEAVLFVRRDLEEEGDA